MKTLTLRVSTIIQITLTFGFLLLMELTTWLPLRFWGVWGGGGFIDTAQILNYSECFSTYKFDIYEARSPNCVGYIYGRTLLVILHFLGLVPSLSFLFGLIFLILLSVLLTYCLPINNSKDVFFYILIVSSPPVMLLAERGNFDILMVCLVFLAGLQLSKGRVLIAALVIALATLIKFYTGPLFLVVLVKCRGLRDKIIVSIVGCITAFLSLIELSDMQQDFPRALGFGFEVWGEYLNKYSSTAGTTFRNQLVAITIFGLCVFGAFQFGLYYFISPISFVRQDTRKKLIANLMCLSFMSSYFLGLSFDYRLIFLVVCILLFIQSEEVEEPQKSYISWILLSILWLSYASSGVAPLGDLLLELLIASTTISYFTYLRRKLSIPNGVAPKKGP